MTWTQLEKLSRLKLDIKDANAYLQQVVKNVPCNLKITGLYNEVLNVPIDVLTAVYKVIKDDAEKQVSDLKAVLESYELKGGE